MLFDSNEIVMNETTFTFCLNKWQLSSSIERNESDNITGTQELSLIGKFSYPKRRSEFGTSMLEFILDEDEIPIEDVDVAFSFLAGKMIPILGNGSPLPEGIGKLIYHGKTRESNPLFCGWCQIPETDFNNLRATLFQKQIEMQIQIEAIGIRIEYQTVGIKKYLKSDQSDVIITSVTLEMNELASDHRNRIIQRKKEFLKEKLLPTDHSFFHSQYNNVLKQVAEKTAEFSIKSEEDEDEFKNRLWDAFEIITDITSAISFPGKEEEESDDTKSEEKPITKHDHAIWFHGNVQNAFYRGYESEHAKKVDKECMTEQAVKYLHRPWMENELLEWVLVDSLMYREIIGFGESIKKYSPKGFLNLNENYYVAKGNIEEMQKENIKDYFENLGNKFIGFFVFPLFIAFLSYRYFSKEWSVIGSVAYLCLLTFFFFIRGIFRFVTRKGKKQETAIEKNAELFDAMNGVYEILKEGTISPKYLREKLYEASKKGAVWPAAVFMVVDHAVKRNPAIWHSPESWKYGNST